MFQYRYDTEPDTLLTAALSIIVVFFIFVVLVVAIKSSSDSKKVCKSFAVKEFIQAVSHGGYRPSYIYRTTEGEIRELKDLIQVGQKSCEYAYE